MYFGGVGTVLALEDRTELMPGQWLYCVSLGSRIMMRMSSRLIHSKKGHEL